MAYFDWNDSMSVGAHLIDSDHRALIAIINELHTEMARGDGPDHQALARLFRDLVTYTQFHFSREERMMQACGYPGHRDHAREHGGFVQFVYDMRNRLARAVERADVEAVLDYLKAWLNHHILVVDAAYRPFFAGNGAAAEAARRFGPGLAEVRGDERPTDLAAD